METFKLRKPQHHEVFKNKILVLHVIETLVPLEYFLLWRDVVRGGKSG